ncbi:lysozyme [Mesorhizobium sp. C386A]|uniref:lysozyme n=1 Tax=unclassified Mesorhizobium TaxID=325217 RepID=UPI0003CE2C54|nr:lysozyme [Mesorhizobium sp. LNJC386A00]ESY35398.1 glycoside hydrolase [Mesorhizobium sp. LNJC386A00]
MPINKIVPTKRGKAAVLGALLFAIASGWTALDQPAPASAPPSVVVQMVRPAVVAPALTPEKLIHQQVAAGKIPPAVKLAVEQMIMPWEGLRTKAYLDTLPKKHVWTVCYGETLNIKKGMKFTREQCKAMLIKRVIHDYYLPLVDGVKDYAIAPMSLQASMISGAYNFGVAGQKGSRTAAFVTKHQYSQACDAQTAWNKAGGKVLPGLVNRRETGDAQRAGEAEICKSGL